MAFGNRFTTSKTAHLFSATNLIVYVVKAEQDSGVYLCISDFVAPKESGVMDYVGMFAVTCGVGCRELCKQ